MTRVTGRSKLREVIAPISRWCLTEGFDTLDLKEAEGAADGIGRLSALCVVAFGMSPCGPEADVQKRLKMSACWVRAGIKARRRHFRF